MEEAYPDIAPTIEVGIGYGKYVSEFDIDVEKITDHLREGGLSDEQILGTTIAFLDGRLSSRIKNATVHGRYEHEEKRATLALPDQLVFSRGIDDEDGGISHSMKERGYSEEEIQDMYQYVDSKIVNEDLRTTLWHELEHRIAKEDPENLKARRNYVQKSIAKASLMMVGVASVPNVATYYGMRMAEVSPDATMVYSALTSLAGVALYARASSRGQHRIYMNNPEEQRCFEAEKRVPEDVVRLTVRKRDMD